MHDAFDTRQFEILSPVHIGNDATISPLSFHHEDEFVYLYDTNEVARHIDSPERLLEIKSRSVSLKQVLGPKIRQLKPIKKIHYWGEMDDISDQEIELLGHENHENFIPGSSLKGSILHAVEFEHLPLKQKDFQNYKNKIAAFSNAFAISDAYFESLETAVQRGVRITAKPSKNAAKQNQDNVKEWLMVGHTRSIHAYFRRPASFDVLKAIYTFTDRYLDYQITYFEFLLDHIDFSRYPITREDVGEILKQLTRYKTLNTEEEPVLIMGRNTHRYSKSNELYGTTKYVRQSGKNAKHPVSRLIVYDAKDRMTLPGMVHLRRP